MEIMTNYLNETTFITLKNNKGMTVILSTCGAGIYEISIDGTPMTKGPKDQKEWMNAASYAGKTVGRYCGRIKDGILDFEGKRYQLPKNEGEKTFLHGGDNRLPYGEWEYSLITYPNAIGVEFNKEDKDSAFPGNIKVKVTYILYKKENVLRLQYSTTSDERTPVSLTSHTFFSLGAKHLDETRVLLRAKEVGLYDELLNLEKWRTNPEYLDFSTWKSFKDCWGAKEFKAKKLQGIDHAYKLSERVTPFIMESKTHRMIISTSYPVILMYTANFITEGQIMNDDTVASVHTSVAVEPEYIPGDYASMTADGEKPQEEFIEYRFEKI